MPTRSGDDPREAQLRMIRDGEAMPVETSLSLNDENEAEDQQVDNALTVQRMNRND